MLFSFIPSTFCPLLHRPLILGSNRSKEVWKWKNWYKDLFFTDYWATYIWKVRGEKRENIKITVKKNLQYYKKSSIQQSCSVWPYVWLFSTICFQWTMINFNGLISFFMECFYCRSPIILTDPVTKPCLWKLLVIHEFEATTLHKFLVAFMGSHTDCTTYSTGWMSPSPQW